MTKSFHVVAMGLCLVFSATAPARAGIVAQNLDGGLGSTLPNFVGQSFTTGPATQYSDITFSFYADSATNPATNAFADADQQYLLLSSEYLGTNGALSNATPGYLATTLTTTNNQWVFDPSVTLMGNTQYWLYGTGDALAQSFAVGGGDPYAGGQRYHSGGGPGNTFSAQTGTDLAFTVDGTPVPQPQAVVNVTYDSPTITGPVSFGLTELPSAPSATFTLAEGTSDGLGSTVYGLDDVLTANMIFGDGVFTTLTAFNFIGMNGIIETMSYTFAPVDTLSVSGGGIVMNSPLFITGTDIASGQAFSYTYANSTETLTNIPEPATMILLAFGGLMLARRRTA